MAPIGTILKRIPSLLAIPFAFIASFGIVLTIEPTQKFFLPPPETIATLIQESESKPTPSGPIQHDVVYDSSIARQYTLDIYGPLEGDTDDTVSAGFTASKPVIVFFHGGSWLRGDKITILIIDRFLQRMRKQGWFVVSVNYTTPILRGFRGPIEQARTAVDWIRDNSDRYGWDPSRIGLYGVSAGGHVALLSVPPAYPWRSGDSAEAITGEPNRRSRSYSPAFVFAECTPTDLVMMREGEAYENSRSFRVFPESLLRRLSPITYVDRSTPPVLLFHGDADRTVDVAQSRRYAGALEEVGGTAELVVWPGGNHAFLNLSDSEWYEQESVALAWMEERFSARE